MIGGWLDGFGVRDKVFEKGSKVGSFGADPGGTEGRFEDEV